jgi:hypothetical protein
VEEENCFLSVLCAFARENLQNKLSRKGAKHAKEIKITEEAFGKRHVDEAQDHSYRGRIKLFFLGVLCAFARENSQYEFSRKGAKHAKVMKKTEDAIKTDR